ncbi:MAG: hypothetical protein O7G85_05065 [Planctomycetota bacterium]|nr:hypothetical protein [Planctomycetota bacterium]
MKIWLLTQAWKYIVAAGVLALVTELAGRRPRIAAIILTLPLTSIVAYLLVWEKEQQLTKIMVLAKETLVLVPLGLPFFLPLAFADRLGLGFWSAFALGLGLAGICIGLWVWLGPKMS